MNQLEQSPTEEDLVEKTVEIRENSVAKMLLGSDCPLECGGKLQIYGVYSNNDDGDDPQYTEYIKCYQCGCEVDPKSVKVTYKIKEKE